MKANLAPQNLHSRVIMSSQNTNTDFGWWLSLFPASESLGASTLKLPSENRLPLVPTPLVSLHSPPANQAVLVGPWPNGNSQPINIWR